MYRKKLFAILEGYGMMKIEQYALFGGIVNELQRESNVKIGKMKRTVSLAEDVLRSHTELGKALEALSTELDST